MIRIDANATLAVRGMNATRPIALR